MTKVLALTVDGRMTYCSSPEELRGKGRCNHIAHKNGTESSKAFMERAGELIQNRFENSIDEMLDVANKENAHDVCDKEDVSLAEALGEE